MKQRGEIRREKRLAAPFQDTSKVASHRENLSKLVNVDAVFQVVAIGERGLESIAVHGEAFHYVNDFAHFERAQNMAG